MLFAIVLCLNSHTLIKQSFELLEYINFGKPHRQDLICYTLSYTIPPGTCIKKVRPVEQGVTILMIT